MNINELKAMRDFGYKLAFDIVKEITSFAEKEPIIFFDRNEMNDPNPIFIDIIDEDQGLRRGVIWKIENSIVTILPTDDYYNQKDIEIELLADIDFRNLLKIADKIIEKK
jgi:hypothetical protein